MEEKSERLMIARQKAGFEKASHAATRFGWKYPTYNGHENGNRGFSHQTARRYASAFKVDVAWLLFGQGQGPQGHSAASDKSEKITYPTQPIRESEGFAEAQIMAWKPKDKAAADSIVGLLAPAAKTPSTFLLGTPIPELFYSAGDVLIVEQGKDAIPGDIVIANKVDYEADTATTIIGKLLPPYIVPPDPKGTPTMVDATVNVVGPVISSFREPKT